MWPDDASGDRGCATAPVGGLSGSPSIELRSEQMMSELQAAINIPHMAAAASASFEEGFN